MNVSRYEVVSHGCMEESAEGHYVLWTQHCLAVERERTEKQSLQAELEHVREQLKNAQHKLDQKEDYICQLHDELDGISPSSPHG